MYLLLFLYQKKNIKPILNKRHAINECFTESMAGYHNFLFTKLRNLQNTHLKIYMFKKVVILMQAVKKQPRAASIKYNYPNWKCISLKLNSQRWQHTPPTFYKTWTPLKSWIIPAQMTVFSAANIKNISRFPRSRAQINSHHPTVCQQMS